VLCLKISDSTPLRYIHTNLYSAKNRENESETLAQGIGASTGGSPVWARGRCRISPPRFLAECCKRQLNQASFVSLYFRLSTFSDLYWVCLSIFSCTVLFVSISQVIGCEDRLRNDLYYVEWGVKLYSIHPATYKCIFLLDCPATLPTAGWLLDRAAFCHCSCCISSHSPPRPVRKCSAKITGRPITVAIAVVCRPTTWYKHGGLVHCFLPLTHLKLCNIIA